jgi:AcrR family transcriptional regulator
MTATVLPDTRSRILDAALGLFSEHGFEGTTLQQIADRLGLTKAALYYHFPSKDDLLAAVHEPVASDLEAVLDAHEGRPETPTARRQFVQDYLDFLLRNRRVISYMFRDLATLSHPVVAAGSGARRARLERLLASDEVDFGEQIRIAMVIGGMHAVIAQYPENDGPELREAVLSASSNLLRPEFRRRPRQRNQGDTGTGPRTSERRRDAP